MQWHERMAAAVCVRRLINANLTRYEAIRVEIAMNHEPVADGLWVRARTLNLFAARRLSYHLAELQELIDHLRDARIHERRRVRNQLLSQNPGSELLLVLFSPRLAATGENIPADESALWDTLPIHFSIEELLSAPLLNTATDGNNETAVPSLHSNHSSRLAATRVETVPQTPPKTHEDETPSDNPMVRESYNSTSELEDLPISPSPSDDVISRVEVG
jgi:hypothetical protein